MKIPKAPADLWRTILRLVTADPNTLNMQYWHSEGGRRASSAECGTEHCIAGWVVALTPGGSELARHIEALFEDQPEALSDILHAGIIEQFENSPEAAAALAIIHESGWQAYVTAEHFFGSKSEALLLLEGLARLEQERESQVSTVDRQATTLIP